MTGILLHKEKGLNPKLTFCLRCGNDANEIMLIGKNDGKYKCSACGMTSYGKQKRDRCPKCEHDFYMVRTGIIEEYDKLPASDYCDDCKKEIKAHKEIVADGGIYWKCSKCDRSGVIKVSAPLATEVRRQHGIAPPAPYGIDFVCPACHLKKTNDQ